MDKPIRAIILAAGRGARMPDHDLPKVLVTIGGNPVNILPESDAVA